MGHDISILARGDPGVRARLAAGLTWAGMAALCNYSVCGILRAIRAHIARDSVPPIGHQLRRCKADSGATKGKPTLRAPPTAALQSQQCMQIHVQRGVTGWS